MICSGTYDDTLGRVRISATAVTGAVVDVDRSVDQINWTRVRGATEVPIVSGGVSPLIDDYEFITSVGFPDGPVCPPVTGSSLTNYYRVVSYNPESMLTVTGGINSCATTPDTAALDITGDIDIQIGIRSDNWFPGEDFNIIGKVSSSQVSWVLQLHSTGVLNFKWSTTGVHADTLNHDVKSTSTIAGFPGEHRAVRVTLDVNNGSGNHVITFYTAANIGDTWKQLGDPITRSGTTSIFSSSAQLIISSDEPFSTLTTPFIGDVTKARIYSGFEHSAGTLVTSPDFTAQAAGTTSFTDAQGRLWTVCSQAEIIVDDDAPDDPVILDTCTFSITPSMNNVWLKSIYRPFLNRRITVLRAFENVSRGFRGGVFNIIGRSFPVGVTDLRMSRRWSFRICAADDVPEAVDLDLVLASGDPLYLQVPNNSNLPVPSMHIIVDGEVEIQKVAWSSSRVFTLPSVEVAAPGADVVGSTSTWQTVLNTYATWQAVLNDNATWLELLELVGDESEILVP